MVITVAKDDAELLTESVPIGKWGRSLLQGAEAPPRTNGGPTISDLVNDLIQQNSAAAEHVCDVLLTFAEPELLSQRTSLLDWVRNELIGEITAVAANNHLYAQSALSERLANKG